METTSRDAAPVLQPGTVLGGRYTVIRELNRGGTAVVYEGVDSGGPSQKGVPVALKVMKEQGQGQGGQGGTGNQAVPIERLKREVKYVSSLPPHPNVVQLLDVFADGGRLVLVWELVRGMDLLDKLNECQGRMDEATAARYVHQVLRALDFLHINGLAHRDIKPENTVLDQETGTIKLIDFGLAKGLNSAATRGVGTPDYIAPEILMNPHVARGHYDAAAVDSWSTGVMLYLLVTGRYPFEDPAKAGSVSHTLKRIQAGLMRPIPLHLSSDLSSLILSLLQRDPSRRLSIGEALRHPWFLRGPSAVPGAAEIAQGVQFPEGGVGAVEGHGAAGGAGTKVVAALGPGTNLLGGAREEHGSTAKAKGGPSPAAGAGKGGERPAAPGSGSGGGGIGLNVVGGTAPSLDVGYGMGMHF